VLRRVFALKADEVTGGWEIPLNEKLHVSQSLPNKFSIIWLERMRWASNVGNMRRRGIRRDFWRKS
jgi:hypothetical protein